MAPNVVKDTPIDALSTLDVSSIVNAKYLPLTHPQEQQQRIEEQQQEQEQQEDNYVEAPHLKDDTHPANSYWDWDDEPTQQNKDSVIERIVEEEKIRQVLSVDHMIQNTIRANLKNEEEQTEMVEESADDYWEMPGDADENASSSPVVAAQHTLDASHPKNSYWDWTIMTEQDKKNAFLEQIVKEEEIRQLLSAGHVHATLIAHAKTEGVDVQSLMESNVDSDAYWTDKQQDECVQAPPHTYDDEHPHASYWSWETLTEQEKKQRLIAQIIKEEEIRQKLSATHLEDNLRKDCAHFGNLANAPLQTAATAGGEQSYWEW